MTLDELARQFADHEKRLNKLEAAEQARNKVRHYPAPKGLTSSGKERPGVALGVSTSLGPYAPFDDDGA